MKKIIEISVVVIICIILDVVMITVIGEAFFIVAVTALFLLMYTMKVFGGRNKSRSVVPDLFFDNDPKVRVSDNAREVMFLTEITNIAKKKSADNELTELMGGEPMAFTHKQSGGSSGGYGSRSTDREAQFFSEISDIAARRRFESRNDRYYSGSAGSASRGTDREAQFFGEISDIAARRRFESRNDRYYSGSAGSASRGTDREAQFFGEISDIAACKRSENKSGGYRSGGQSSSTADDDARFFADIASIVDRRRAQIRANDFRGGIGGDSDGDARFFADIAAVVDRRRAQMGSDELNKDGGAKVRLEKDDKARGSGDNKSTGSSADDGVYSAFSQSREDILAAMERERPKNMWH